jgi:hypothetical protein
MAGGDLVRSGTDTTTEKGQVSGRQVSAGGEGGK